MNMRAVWRGKRVDNGEWVQGNYLYDHVGDTHYIVTFFNNLEFELKDVEVDPESLGQCTGLKDKDGEWIFEWDKVKSRGETSVVYWDRGMFMIKVKSNFGLSSIPLDTFFYDGETDCEIILLDNIHDNPELIEEN